MNPAPPKSDNPVTAKFRQLQSDYREKVLKVSPGYGPTANSKNKHGNMLIDGENSGLNFISEAAFRFAKQKVLDKQVNKAMTIDAYRLFNNMLSSMPMCFNLFSDLREGLLTDPDFVSKIIKGMFKELDWIEKVTYVDVEFIPVPISDYTDDKSAFDAMILVEDKVGKKGLISIETKYTDLLGSNSSTDNDLKSEILNHHRIFKKPLIEELNENGYKQIHRNYLLTYAYAKKNKFKHFANVVISPKEDSLSIKEIEDMRKDLLQDSNTILKIALEEIVGRGKGFEELGFDELMKKFQKRYLG